MSPRPDRIGNKPSVAVVGAGWAGLAAAYTLKRAGWATQVFEQSPVLGGRARKAVIPRSGLTLDNGQHLLLGAYRHVLDLMQDVGVDMDRALLRMPLQLASLNGDFCLKVNPAHPKAWRLPAALMRLKGLSAGQKFALLRAIFQLQLSGWRVQPDTSVHAWLKSRRQPCALLRVFWEPLCIATLNTPIAQASMSLFARVLKDSLAAGADASDLILPRVDLSTLWPDALASQLTIHTNTPVRGIQATSGGYRLLTGHRNANEIPSSKAPDVDDTEDAAIAFDAVILATPPLIAHRLLWRLMHDNALSMADAPSHDKGLPDRRQVDEHADSIAKTTLLAHLHAFDYHAIATLTVLLDAPFPLKDCMYMLNEDRATGQHGQWLFNRSQFMASDDAGTPWANLAATAAPNAQSAGDTPHSISIVISHADHLVGTDRDLIANAILSQVRSQLPDGVTLPKVKGYELIMEKKATFAATPGLVRPENETPWRAIFLAGDWTNTGYPGVLEGAVMSGRDCAEAVQKAFSDF